MDDRKVLVALGGIRLGVGAGLVLAPTVAGRIWIGDDAVGPGTRVFARSLGARDAVLGATLLSSLKSGDRVAAGARARTGVLADVADVAATLIAVRQLEGSRRWAMPLIAAAVGAAGVAVWKVADEVEQAAGDDQKTAQAPTPSSAPAPESVAEREGIVDQQAAVLTAME